MFLSEIAKIVPSDEIAMSEGLLSHAHSNTVSHTA